MRFRLDDRLAADTLPCGKLPLSRVLLMNEARYPWLILVPERPDVRELFELTAADRATLIEEIALVGTAIARTFSPDKVNIAALGNIVAQLHVHVVGRFAADSAWPAPVWGRSPPLPYTAGDAAAMIDRVRSALGAGVLPFVATADR